jgi:hypothetical protein
VRLAIASFLGLTSLAAAAHAEFTRVPGAQQELRDYTEEYSRCMVRFHHADARALILSNTPNDRLERDFGNLYTSKPLASVQECERLFIRDKVAFQLQPDAFRGALAAALIAKDMPKAEAGNFADRAPLSHWAVNTPAVLTVEHGDAAKLGTKDRAAVEQIGRAWLSRYGECLVRGNARSAHDLILSKPGSAAEASALAQMNPVFAGCLAQGETMTFGKVVLRDAVAVNYYRLAMAAPVSSNGVAH